MSTPSYRVAGFASPKGTSYVKGWKLEKAGEDVWLKAIPAFESACIIYEFDDAILALPFTVTNETQLEDLEKLHKHIRVITGAEVGESLFDKSKAGVRSSDSATQLLLQMMLTNSIQKEDAHKLIIQLAK